MSAQLATTSGIKNFGKGKGATLDDYPVSSDLESHSLFSEELHRSSAPSVIGRFATSLLIISKEKEF